jgi:hypothetical protein
MNEVIVINNPSKPPSVYEYRTQANAALDSRPNNVSEDNSFRRCDDRCRPEENNAEWYSG